jgi:SAM-dependent methyltransferase
MSLLAPALTSVGFDDRGVTVPGGTPSPLLLHVDGQYVWSFDAARDGHLTPRGRLVPWPEVLRPYLAGTATLRLESADGDVVTDQEVTLGDAPGRISVTDRKGHPLAVDKVGHLGRVFSETEDGVRAEVIEGTARLLRDLREECRVEAYLNYGCLLGAVRDGRMISHDFDSDVCYLSEHTSPADVVAESFRVQRTLRRLGWRTVRMSGGDVKVVLPLSDGRSCHIDVFGAFYVDDVFYQLGNRSGRLPREAVLPVSTVTLEGVELPAPADPEAMLAFLYGPRWRVPDPSFKYADPPAGVRRLDGWLRGFRSHAPAWSELFDSPAASRIPRKGSGFATWAHRRAAPDDGFVDLGCGNARDTTYFLHRGRRVQPLDFSVSARRVANRRLKKLGKVRAKPFMLGDLRRVLSLAAELAHDPSTTHLYARRLVSCLDDIERANLWLLGRVALRSGGSLFLEFPALVPGEDLPDPHLERRLDPDEVAAEIRASGGEVHDLTVQVVQDLFDEPDPAVCRLRATWPQRRATPTPPDPQPEETPMTVQTRVRGRVRRSLATYARRGDLSTRLAHLEAEVQENRQLNRRIAELTDVVAELLVPLQDRDEEQVKAALATYRQAL